ncbi:phage terminase large subunit family protein [Fibrobacter sp.]|uniref:phage terminase large subunit family protein n=1 Tax=Fibrobacter sp. TaxID=35828 RepID=UPI003890B289
MSQEVTMPQDVAQKQENTLPFTDNVVFCLQGFLEGLTPPKDQTISQWAEENRILAGEASASKGKWTNERTPYLVEIMDMLSPQSPCSDVAFMKGSQIGGTEAMINTALYYMLQSPCPIGLYQTTDDVAAEFERQRLAPTFAAMKMDQYFTGDTAGCKEYPGGIFFLGSGGSAAQLRSKPLQVVLCDEISGWVEDCNGEGDPCDLVKRRTTNFPRKKRFWNSTPTIKGKCRITKKYKLGDQREYNVPCPHCGELYVWKFAHMVWDRDADGNHLPYTARMRCPHCGKDTPEYRKTELMAQGQWVATNPNGAYPSYHLPAFYSPLGWYSWEEAVTEFLEAQGDVQKLKVWTNNVAAEAWDEENQVHHDYSELELRKEDYGCEVPEGARVLTVGVDTQDDRLECEIVGWGKGLESWSIGYWIIPGDPDLDEVWETLDEIINAPYEKADGTQLFVAAGLVDSGGHKTSAVYKYCAKREWRKIYASIGARGPNRPVISRPSSTKKSSAENAKLITVGTDTVKDWFFNVLSYDKPGPGYCHFPEKEIYDGEHFKQLTAEVKKSRLSRGFLVHVYEKVYERNEPLDCRVYSRAALNIVGVDVDKMESMGVNYTKNPMVKKRVARSNYMMNTGKRI